MTNGTTLLEQARAVPAYRKNTGTRRTTPDEEELLLAWLKDELTNKQVMQTLKIRNVSGIYSWAIPMIRGMVRRGKIKLNKVKITI